MRSEKNPWTTRLGHAILQGDVSSLVRALEEGDDPNVPAIPTEWTIQPLGLALLMMNNLSVLWLLRFGAEINAIYDDAGGFGKGCSERCTPLFLAEYTGNRAAERLLLKNGADRSLAQREGITWSTFQLPGFRALGSCPTWRVMRAMRGRMPIQELDLKLRRVPDLDSGRGDLIATACSLGRIDYLELLVAHGADPNACRSRAFTALAGPGTAIAKRLLELGFDPNFQSRIEPLALCCAEGRPDLVALLLAFGANPQGTLWDASTPDRSDPEAAAIEAHEPECLRLVQEFLAVGGW